MKPQIEIGSHGNWLLMRLTEAFVLLIAMPVLYLLKPPAGVELSFAILLAVAVLAVWHPVAHGSADETGMRYRHYFTWHELAWTAVERIDWSSAWIVLIRKEGFLLGRRIVFPLQRSMSDALAEAAGKALPEPAAVTGLKEFAQAHGLELRGIQRVKPKQAMVALTIFLSLAVVVALATWAWLQP